MIDTTEKCPLQNIIVDIFLMMRAEGICFDIEKRGSECVSGLITSVRISAMFEIVNLVQHFQSGCMNELPSLNFVTPPSLITIL